MKQTIELITWLIVIAVLLVMNIYGDTIIAKPTATPVLTSTGVVLKAVDIPVTKVELVSKTTVVTLTDTKSTVVVTSSITTTAEVIDIINKLQFPFGYGSYGFPELKTGYNFNVDYKAVVK